MNDRSKCCRKFLWSFHSFYWSSGRCTRKRRTRSKIAYSSTDTLNQIWTIPQDAGFYKKNGLDVELVYIGSTTVGVSAIVAQDIQVGNAAGSGVANANVRGADTVSVGCMINVLAYELVVLDSIKSAEDLKGKSIGISRFGSVSDVAARELLKGLGLRPHGRREDPASWRRGGARGRLQPRRDRGISIAAGKRASDSRRHCRIAFSQIWRISKSLIPCRSSAR